MARTQLTVDDRDYRAQSTLWLSNLPQLFPLQSTHPKSKYFENVVNLSTIVGGVVPNVFKFKCGNGVADTLLDPCRCCLPGQQQSEGVPLMVLS